MIYKYKTTVAVTTGSGATNTNPVIGGICREVLVKPDTATNTYKINIVDEDSITVKTYDFKKGQYIDTTPFIAYGVYTINITDATIDENFIVRFMVEE